MQSSNLCTIAGFRDEQGRVIIGKTDDINDFELGSNVLQNAQPDQGHNYTGFGFAGSIGIFAGMNQLGLTAVFTGIPGPILDEEGAPAYQGCHAVLSQCATVAEAVEFIETLKINWYGFSVMLGDAAGNLTVMEKTGAGTVIIPEQQGGFFLHTNHILDADFAAKNPPQAELVDVNGRRRYDNGLELLSNLPHSEIGMKNFLNDRSQTGAICQEGTDGLYSDYRAVFIPTEKKCLYWPGYSRDTEEEQC